MSRASRLEDTERRRPPVAALTGTMLAALAFALVTGAALGLLLAKVVEWCLDHVAT
jgi:predicted MFS family arabinose efflux permease